jgi:hypothetical protein
VTGDLAEYSVPGKAQVEVSDHWDGAGSGWADRQWRRGCMLWELARGIRRPGPHGLVGLRPLAVNWGTLGRSMC